MKFDLCAPVPMSERANVFVQAFESRTRTMLWYKYHALVHVASQDQRRNELISSRRTFQEPNNFQLFLWTAPEFDPSSAPVIRHVVQPKTPHTFVDIRPGQSAQARPRNNLSHGDEPTQTRMTIMFKQLRLAVKYGRVKACQKKVARK